MNDLLIETVKTGDTVCTIYRDGEPGGLYTVGEFSEIHGKFRLLRQGDTRDIGLLPVDGLGYYAMHSRESGPHFYYSANPLHIDQARQRLTMHRQEQQAQAKKKQASLQALRLEIEALLNKYDASLTACQTAGDDQGVELGLFLSIGDQELKID